MPLASGCARGLEFEVMAVDACSEAELQRRVDKPNFPELVSGPERPRSLASSASACTSSPAHPGFPEPLYRLGVGSLWIRQSIETFAQHWERRPGRPRNCVNQRMILQPDQQTPVYYSFYYAQAPNLSGLGACAAVLTVAGAGFEPATSGL
jgi:hypothetical protein